MKTDTGFRLANSMAASCGGVKAESVGRFGNATTAASGHGVGSAGWVLWLWYGKILWLWCGMGRFCGCG